MSIKTVRFNKEEARKLKRLLSYYRSDFSTCVKGLIDEKIEDLADLGMIQKMKEGRTREDYYSAKEIDALFKHRSK